MSNRQHTTTSLAPVQIAWVRRIESLLELGRQAHTAIRSLLGRDHDDKTAARLHARPAEPAPKADVLDEPAATAESSGLLPHLRSLLRESARAVDDCTSRLESRPDQIDEQARVQLCDWVLLLDEHLAALKAWLIAPVDWDSEYERLLAGEIPPLFDGADDDEDTMPRG